MTFDASSGLTASSVVTIASGAVCNNWTASGIAAIGVTFQLSANFSPSGAVSLTGNSRKEQLWVNSSAPGTARTLTVATLSALTNVDFMDIAGAGAASPFTGTAVGDCGGNSGITFTVAATQTFAGGTANWSSGAAWTSRVPLPQDNVIVNTTTAGTLTMDMPRLGKDIDFTSFTRTLGGSVAVFVFGSLTYSSTMTVSATSTWAFRGRGTHTITNAGKSVVGPTINCVAPGSYTLGDNLSASTQTLTMSRGTLGIGAFTLTVKNIAFSTTVATAITGTGTINLAGTGTLTVWNGDTAFSLTFATTITIAVTATDSGVTKTFAGGGLTYGTVKHVATGSAALTITGNNTFDTLDLECTTARTVTLPASGTQTVNTALTLQGASGQNLTVQSSSGGTTTTIQLAAAVTYTNSNLTRTSDVIINWVKSLAGGTTPSGGMPRKATTTPAGAATPAGSFGKGARTSILAASTPAGALAKSARPALAGTLTSAGALARRTGKALASTLTPAGSLVSRVAISLAATVAPAGALAKSARPALAGTVTSAGALAKQASRPLSSVLEAAGTLAKVARPTLAGAIEPAAERVQKAAQSLGGTLAPAGAMARGVATTLAGSIAPEGALDSLHTIFLSVVGALAPVGALVRRTATSLGGLLHPTGGLDIFNKAIIRLSASLHPVGALSKRAAVPFAGTLTATGTLLKRARIHPAGLLTPAGAVRRAGAKTISASISTVGRFFTPIREFLTGFSSSPTEGDYDKPNPRLTP